MKSTKMLFAVLVSVLSTFAIPAFAGDIDLQPMSDGSCAVKEDGVVKLIIPNDQACMNTKARVEGQLAQSGQQVAAVQSGSGWSFGRVTIDLMGGVGGFFAGKIVGKAIAPHNKSVQTFSSVVGAVLGAGTADEMQRGGRGVGMVNQVFGMGAGYTDMNNITANQRDAIVTSANIQRGHDRFAACMRQVGNRPGANAYCGQMSY